MRVNSYAEGEMERNSTGTLADTHGPQSSAGASAGARRTENSPGSIGRERDPGNPVLETTVQSAGMYRLLVLVLVWLPVQITASRRTAGPAPIGNLIQVGAFC